MPRRISMASSMAGSFTRIDWNRRSSAASFSMDLWYSLSVVAPTTCSSPRARAGLRIFAASIAPSAPPAPTSVWISSRNSTTLPTSFTSSISCLRRSSNCPRYCVPATTRAMSRETTRLSRMRSGTSPRAMACARPSTTAVLPTPASPISTALFFVRRERTWMTRVSSCLRPMTGSSSPLRARAVRSRPKMLSAGVLPFFAALASPSGAGDSSSSSSSVSSGSGASSADSASSPSARASARMNASGVRPCPARICAATDSPSARMARIMCSVPTADAWRRRASSLASSRILRVRAVTGISPSIRTFSLCPIICSSCMRSSSGSTSSARNRRHAPQFGMARMEQRRCSVPM